APRRVARPADRGDDFGRRVAVVAADLRRSGSHLPGGLAALRRGRVRERARVPAARRRPGLFRRADADRVAAVRPVARVAGLPDGAGRCRGRTTARPRRVSRGWRGGAPRALTSRERASTTNTWVNMRAP